MKKSIIATILTMVVALFVSVTISTIHSTVDNIDSPSLSIVDQPAIPEAVKNIPKELIIPEPGKPQGPLSPVSTGMITPYESLPHEVYSPIMGHIDLNNVFESAESRYYDRIMG